MNSILTQQDLYDISGVRQPARLISWLERTGIRYKYNAKREVFTTLEQLNAAFDVGQDSIDFGYGQES